MSAAPDHPTRVIGHRGSPRRALENTLDSFDAAEAEGADGFELDVRLLADGEVVLSHDADFPVAGGAPVPVAGLTLFELPALRLGRDGREGLPCTLRDVFLRFAGQVRYLVELKMGPTPKPGLLEFRVAALLDSFHLSEKASVLSFSPDSLRRLHEVAPALPTVLNFDATTFRPAGQLWPDLPPGCRGIGPHVALCSDRLFAEARESGLDVHVWTVNDPATAARMASLGAASVITDVPALVGPAVREVTGAPTPLLLAGRA